MAKWERMRDWRPGWSYASSPKNPIWLCVSNDGTRTRYMPHPRSRRSKRIPKTLPDIVSFPEFQNKNMEVVYWGRPPTPKEKEYLVRLLVREALRDGVA